MARKKIIKKTTTKPAAKAKCSTMSCGSGCGGCAYFLGFLGSAVYYISTATGFWMGVLGVLKSLVWPAFVMHALMKFLGM